MKLLYINGSRIPTERAHGLQIMKMCEAFAGAGSDVELWLPRRFGYAGQNQHDPFEYYGIQRNFTMRKFFCVDLIPLSGFLGPPAVWVTETSFLFAVFVYLLTAPLRQRRRGAGSSEDKKKCVLYTRDKFVAFLFSFFKKNIFFEAHDVPADIFFSRFKKIRGIIAITHNLKDEFMRRGVSAEKVIVAPDGVDLAEFDISETQAECREKLGIPQDKKIVLYTGHLYPWKGAAVLLAAAKVLSIKYQVSSILLTFVGGMDKDIAGYQILNTKYQILNTRFVGHRAHKEIPYWLKAADILVLPNSAKYGISKYWTSPMKLFEYMAAGRPIIASDLPSIREVLSEKNAKLVAPDNAEVLASGILYLLSNQSEAERISAQARADVKLYTWEKRAERIWQLFQRK